MPAVPATDTVARRVAVGLTAVLLLPATACTGQQDDAAGRSGAARDVPVVARDQVAFGGTVRWAIEEVPTTLNAFQPDASGATARIAEATLPALFTLDSRARPQLNTDYLKSAEVMEEEPRQKVVYTLNPEARWSDGRPLSAADFKAQWQALNGENSAFWSARNAGYERIESVRKGERPHQVAVTFTEPYADWKSLFTPLYPKSVMGEPKAFNERARAELPVSAGPFRVKEIGSGDEHATLVRDGDWWGDRAKLDRIVLQAVPRERREEALADGDLDLAGVRLSVAERISAAKPSDDAKFPDGKAPEGAKPAGAGERQRGGKAAAERRQLRDYAVRRALEPAYTQLALNGASGPLADKRVRRAVARAIDREELAKEALAKAGLPAKPLGSHLRMHDQQGYHDNSGALGGRDVTSAQDLLADAGWHSGAGVTEPDTDASVDAKKDDANKDDANKDTDKGRDNGEDATTDDRAPGERPTKGRKAEDAAPGSEQDSELLVTAAEAARVQGAPLALGPDTAAQRAGLLAQRARTAERAAEEAAVGGETTAREARKAKRTAERARKRADEMRLLTDSRTSAVRVKQGEPLSLRFLLPAGPGSETIQRTGERIARALNGIGVRTDIERVEDESYFRDHIASGDYDLALYTWPATAYPATDTQPIFAKPMPSPDGSLLVEQNYTRVGTDRIDQLFAEAARELDEGERRDLLRDADERIWAAAGSVPLYQRPQLIAAKKDLVNGGAFGFQTPSYQDIGYRK
ncbi:ABC transporter family substrate-binding protein [Streptomyces oceani]|uniref:Solute-binding protein family 5 domain-containing protein n=1 Tax=Streptomyces oceani TaxID=1075402 RepID=A0A1E7JJ39_9ACTN|nr:ABC transporter family substrate-binding protein [Streptomyces oceani]OEU87660.1 hypothetical protein AN216_26015 [Streptomyces oceani]